MWPMRKKLGATRAQTAAVSLVSRKTGISEPTTAKARDVGTPKKCMASLHKNSRIDERKTARPSPILE